MQFGIKGSMQARTHANMAGRGGLKMMQTTPCHVAPRAGWCRSQGLAGITRVSSPKQSASASSNKPESVSPLQQPQPQPQLDEQHLERLKPNNATVDPQASDFFEPMHVQDLVMSTATYETFLAYLQQDSTLHQDLLSFAAQPWFDRPWFKINTHPALAGLFNGAQPEDIAMLKHIADTIDLSITEAQIKWFVKMLKQVSAAPVIYTGMTNLSTKVFNYTTLDALDRTITHAITPQRLHRAIYAGAKALGISTPAPGTSNDCLQPSSTLQAAIAGFQAHWTKARRTRYLDLLDTIQTDEHYGRVAQIAEQLANLATPNNLDQFFCSLDRALPEPRLQHLATCLAQLLSDPWGSAIAARLDDALEAAQLEHVLRVSDSAVSSGRINAVPPAVLALGKTLGEGDRMERVFRVLDHMLTNERRKQYGNLIDQVTSDPARLKAWWAALVQAATPDSAGGLMDMALSTMTPGRLDKAARLGGALWGTDAKLSAWLAAVDRLNVGSHQAERLMAVADELADEGKLPHLKAAAAQWLSPKTAQDLGQMIDGATTRQVDRLASLMSTFPAASSFVQSVMQWVWPKHYMVLTLRALDEMVAEPRAVAAARRVVAVTLADGPVKASDALGAVGAALALTWSLHVKMIRASASA